MREGRLSVHFKKRRPLARIFQLRNFIFEFGADDAHLRAMQHVTLLKLKP